MDMTKQRFFVKRGNRGEQEVTMEEFIAAERSAGFQPKPGRGPLATGGFSVDPGKSFQCEGISGRIEYVSLPSDTQEEAVETQ